MRVGVYGRDAPPAAARAVRSALRGGGIDAFPVQPRQGPGDARCVVVLGGDKGVRSYFRHAAAGGVPVLGVGEAEEGGFLAQVDAKDLPAYVDRIRRRDYAVEEAPRVGVRIDGRAAAPALNDVAVFPSRSAVLMEHTLRVDGDDVWHDSSDGVIVSTPMGSSAYSMSVGGPVVFQDARVLGVISVNSLDVTRRPLVVPDSSSVEVAGVSAGTRCEAVLDGIERRAVARGVECTRAPGSAGIVRLRRRATAISALEKKVRLAEDLRRMPTSSKLLLKVLEYHGPMTQKQMTAAAYMPERTVRMALGSLVERGYVRRRVSARDARQRIFDVAGGG